MDGVNDRLPLKLVGTSLPPHITLNLETRDMDRVYINKTYNYEIVAMNKGYVDLHNNNCRLQKIYNFIISSYRVIYLYIHI